MYNSYRLTVLAQCAHGTGIIEVIRTEADGDDHVLVHMDPDSLDPNGGHWINATNTSLQHGDLVVEVVCLNPITQSDAQSACAGYANPQGAPPPVGTHVEISGPWVTDTLHLWNELHPVTFRILPALTDPIQGSD